MKLTHKFLTLSLASVAVLGGCTTKTDRTVTTTTTTTTATDGTSSGGVLPEFHAPNPGAYGTLMVGDAEMREGVYPIGKFGGTLLRPIVASDPKTFNYWASDDSSSSMITGYMFSPLVSSDPYTGDVVPDLASEVRMEPDQVTYITKLRKGLKWSDGKPITSADVAYTWNTIIAGGYGNTSLRDVTQVDGKSPQCIVVDELTNKFVTAKPFAPFMRMLGVPIAPKHVFEPITNGKDGKVKFGQKWAKSTDPAKLKELVTSGPFVLSRFVPAQRVEMTRTNNNYTVNKDGKRMPYLDRMVFTFVPEPNTLQLKFRNGDIDVTTVRARDVQTLLAEREKGNFQLYRLGPSTGSTFIMFNMNQRKNAKGKPIVDPIKAKWFNDTNFRQAVNHGVNRENIVANYFKGIGHPDFTAELPSSPWYNSALTPFKQDTAFSDALLKKSGFVKKGADLYDKDGNRVEFNLVMGSGSTFYEAAANSFATDMKALGIKVNIQPVEFNVLIDRMDNTKEWEASLFSLTGDPMEPNNGANVWKTAGRLHLYDLRYDTRNPNTVVTDARPWETEIDTIFNQGAQTFVKEDRKKLYDRFQQIIYDEAPMIYLVRPTSLIGARNTVGNFAPTPLTSSVGDGLHNLEEIYKTDATGVEPPAAGAIGASTTTTSTSTSTDAATSTSTATTTMTTTGSDATTTSTSTTTAAPSGATKTTTSTTIPPHAPPAARTAPRDKTVTPAPPIKTDRKP